MPRLVKLASLLLPLVLLLAVLIDTPYHALSKGELFGIDRTKTRHETLLGWCTLLSRAPSDTFVTRAQLRRVMLVFLPTAAFCLAMQYLGLYVASFLLIAGFMRFVGKIAWWKSLLTAFLFTAIMFATFDIAFDVIMPKGPLEAAFGR